MKKPKSRCKPRTPVVHPGHPDFPLLKAEIRWKAAEQEVNYHHCSDKVVDKFCDEEINPRIDEVATLPAQTAAGVAVKLRMLQHLIGESHNYWSDDLFHTMFAALKRLEPVEW